MRPSFLPTLCCLLLSGCPEEKAPVREDPAQLVKNRVDRERDDKLLYAPPEPVVRTPDFTRLLTASACPPELAIPLLPAVAPAVCFGQSPAAASAAWTKVRFHLTDRDGGKTATVAIADAASPFSRVTLLFESGVLEGVELEPVVSKEGGPAVVQAVDAALGRSDQFEETPAYSSWFQIGVVHWYRTGTVHALLDGPPRKGQWRPRGPIWIFRAGEGRDAIAAHRFEARVEEQRIRNKQHAEQPEY